MRKKVLRVIFKNKMKKLGVLLALVAVLFVLEPYLRDKATFAVTFFGDSPIQYENESGQFNANAPEVQTAEQASARQKTRAPEPGTLLFFLGGILGIIIRFAQRSFEKFKRGFDLFLAVLGLLIASPLLFFAGLLIKSTSKGPLIYRQNRLGKEGEIFRIYKLRTMVMDAENGTGAVWAKKNDPRITPVGRVLRKTHIDEIPQLFNVIRGDMSIVGPRPERPELAIDLKTLILDYEKRLRVKPGITGLAQVVHKYDETIQDVKKKIKYDLLYARKMSFGADLKILAQTFLVVVTGKGAH